jgi:hypothetical protein
LDSSFENVGDSLQEREKKAFFIQIRMNSSSLSWASYCSSAYEFRPKEETDAKCFAELFVIFLSFQPNRKADENALNISSINAAQSMLTLAIN